LNGRKTGSSLGEEGRDGTKESEDESLVESDVSGLGFLAETYRHHKE